MEHGLNRLKEILENNYLPKARWWPWKNTRRQITIVSFQELDGLVFLKFKADNQNFQLPLMKTTGEVNALRERTLCVEKECFVEAEYHPEYYSLISKLPGIEIEVISEPPRKIVSAKPVTLESTNAVSLLVDDAGEKYVLKSYRLLPETNLEALMIKALALKKFENIPKVYLLIKHEEQVAGILMKYVEGVGDGGYPFYTHLIEYLRKSARLLATVGLSAKLGTIIGNMHKALNIGHSDRFYGLEEIGLDDIENWIKRMHRYLNTILTRLDEIAAAGESVSPEWMEKWRGLIDNKGLSVVEEASSYLRAYEGLDKGRIHQDLHLAQMIYIPSTNDFIITDFEGEPGRSPEERVAKEPLLRDLATMVRSYHYLSHAAVMNAYAVSIDQASDIMLNHDPTLEWRLRNMIAMVNSYLASIVGSELARRYKEMSPRKQLSLIYPWIVERSLYEAYYESMYRSEWVSIPIIGLFDPLLVFLK
ncbi:alpha-amylase [Thermosphaera chiliense]|uniref:Alpha-amylase n=1 Tax=Thermosphaera chiliense TaxID=3402707 RepID=A0A7M1UR27_9CREN|nr:alpha-amylase [Thermosphaera aggregans]QOR93903.1 alpha-amylase [Thermosphaera aggregans]